MWLFVDRRVCNSVADILGFVTHFFFLAARHAAKVTFLVEGVVEAKVMPKLMGKRVVLE